MENSPLFSHYCPDNSDHNKVGTLDFEHNIQANESGRKATL
jgi:hypothetical protein